MMSDFSYYVTGLSLLSKEKLLNILDNIQGSKTIVIDSSLSKPLDRFISFSEIKRHNVTRIYRLERTGAQVSNCALVYFVPCELKTCKVICDQINSCLSQSSPNVTFHVIFLPRLLNIVDKLFEEEGLIGLVNFIAFGWDLIPLDSSILSYECPSICRQLFIESDQSLLPAVAQSLWSLQHLFGKIPFTFFHGKYSKIISKLIGTYFEEIGVPDKPNSEIGGMIVIDRDVDYSSVLLTPGTYTSLVADVMEVKSSVVTIEKANAGSETPAKVHLFSSNDDIYCQIRNKHFSEVFIHLNRKIKELNIAMGRHKQMGIKELKDYVQNHLGDTSNMTKTLSTHINICEKVTQEIGQEFEKLQSCQNDILTGSNRQDVIAYLEDLMAEGRRKNIVLRLLSLLSLTQDGFTSEECQQLKAQFVHAFGYDYLTTFYHLEKMGLFTQSSGEFKLKEKMVQVVSLPKKSSFHVLAQKLKLFPSAEYSLKEPQDMSYVFNGSYIPLVAQIVNILISKEMSLDELGKVLSSHPAGKPNCSVLDGYMNINPNCLLVYIVGGITYAEIAALQLLEKKTNFRFLAAGSSIITGNDLVQAAK